VALVAYRAATLTGSGTVAGWLVGTLVLHGTGWEGGGVLAAFFVSSNLVSRGAPPPAGLDPKSDRRDHRQVLANGGVAGAAAVLGLHDPRLGIWLLTSALAAAAADTWATAFGARSTAPPRLIFRGCVVPAGTSGGITLLGSAGGAAGAMLVAAAGALASGLPALLPVAGLVGFGGMMLDSALGAVAQGRFRCVECGERSEWRRHRCGRATDQLGGLAWLDNDGVNLTAGVAAAIVAGGAWAWLCPCA
jgi:uncharacterized protein (TIGR00297 family)